MIRLEVASDEEASLWHALLDLAERAKHWTLIGARMVELHTAEAGRTNLRASLDGDVLADARTRPNAVRRIAQILADEGFLLEEPSYMGVGHTFVRGGVEIDLLAPEHLGAFGARADDDRGRAHGRGARWASGSGTH